MSVRVRFAPSPTGPLHIGGVRTALYNYLFAKKNGGTMILRIEDTDQSRFVEGAEEYIKNALEWLGIKIDEGVSEGGNYGPYKQSERKKVYAEYAQQLIDNKKAYYAFDSTEELDDLRRSLEEAKVDNISYNAVTRLQMKNSLTLSEEEVNSRIANGEPYVIRLKVPLKEEIRFKDLVRDWVVVHSSTIDDKILMKSDGMPTYHLANIVDDHLMQITHVIRGEEWLPSAPLHILLYKSFGWNPPQFAHLPLLLKPEGNGKLSKRDGLLGDFPVFPLIWKDSLSGEVSRGFREDGYFPNAVLNFLALLGWNPGTEKEIFSMEELITHFSLESINKAGARFDVNKAKWFNQQYLKASSDQFLMNELQNYSLDSSLASKLIRLMRDRVIFVKEIVTEVPYLFEDVNDYDEEVVQKKWDDLAKKSLPIISKIIADIDPMSFESQNIHDKIFSGLEEEDIKPGKIMQALRLALTGHGKGPDLMLIIEILGKQKVIDRINKAILVLS
jgi:glutamyl-tRNA synthetase